MSGRSTQPVPTPLRPVQCTPMCVALKTEKPCLTAAADCTIGAFPIALSRWQHQTLSATLRPFNRQHVPYYCFDTIPASGRVGHAVFTRQGGVSRPPYDSLNLSVSVPDLEENVYANRATAYGLYGRSKDTLVHAHLVHGAGVAVVTQADHGRYVGPVDGLITSEPGCGLTMNYADCAPIFLYDPRHQAIGLGHAGWKGAVADLPGALARAMVQTFASRPAELIAAIGPAIGPCCYEVGQPVLSAVDAAFPEADELLRPAGREDKRFFDLPLANARRLAAAGVEQIELSQLCTACRTDLFFSHRAEGGRTGRFGVVFFLT
jgi:YfiH family protein